MFDKILSVTGKSGLYKLVSRGSNSLIVESIDAAHHRMPVFVTTKVIALDNIAMYTNNEEMPLRKVMENLKKKYKGAKCDIDYKTADSDTLFNLLEEVLPNYDGDRIYTSDVKKLVQWYNILVENNLADFSDPEETPKASAESDSNSKATKVAKTIKTATKTTAEKSEQKAARKVTPKTAAKKAAPVKSANRKAQ